ncbi:MAG TPA: PepSY domain-containing protein [Polyangiaceae bacterium]
MKRWMWLVAAALATAGTVATATTVQADEKNEGNENETPVSLDKIPKAAADALTREAGGARILDVVQETENGQTVYEAHVQSGNQVLGIEVDATGKVLKRENESNEKHHK